MCLESVHVIVKRRLTWDGQYSMSDEEGEVPGYIPVEAPTSHIHPWDMISATNSMD